MRQIIVGSIKSLLWLLGVIAPAAAVALAFKLFCQPAARAKVRSHERAVMAQASTETLTVRGQRVVVYRWGGGERPVLLMHGWESRGARFSLLAEQLRAKGYSPITFDAPGHGESEDNKTTIVDYLAISEALHQRYGQFEAVVAHSFGVLCAFYALKQGVGARCAVAISGVSDFRYLLDTFSSQLGLLASTKAALRERIEGLFAPLPDIWNRFTVTHDTQGLAQPVLVIHDRQDDTVAFSQARLTAEHFGGRARLIATGGLGHNRILRDASVLGTVCDFIDRARQPESGTNAAAVLT